VARRNKVDRAFSPQVVGAISNPGRCPGLVWFRTVGAPCSASYIYFRRAICRRSTVRFAGVPPCDLQAIHRAICRRSTVRSAGDPPRDLQAIHRAIYRRSTVRFAGVPHQPNPAPLSRAPLPPTLHRDAAVPQRAHA